MRCNSKGMSCGEFVQLMRDRGFTYDHECGRFISGFGNVAGKTTKNGYRTLMLQKDKIQYTFCEHRCVWVWFHGDIPEGYEINHIDADRGNNRIENLEVVNHSQNMLHAVKLGNFHGACGEDSGKAVFTNDEVRTMRYLYGEGWSIKRIGELFGKDKYWVSVGRLVKGKRYGSVIGSIPEWKAQEIVRDRMEQQQNLGRHL